MRFTSIGMWTGQSLPNVDHAIRQGFRDLRHAIGSHFSNLENDRDQIDALVGVSGAR